MPELLTFHREKGRWEAQSTVVRKGKGDTLKVQIKIPVFLFIFGTQKPQVALIWTGLLFILDEIFPWYYYSAQYFHRFFGNMAQEMNICHPIIHN